jgi:hypothetical protein
MMGGLAMKSFQSTILPKFIKFLVLLVLFSASVLFSGTSGSEAATETQGAVSLTPLQRTSEGWKGKVTLTLPDDLMYVSVRATELSAYNMELWHADATVKRHLKLLLSEEPTENTAKDNSDIRVLINGLQHVFDPPPVIRDGRTLVPMRALFEALGADVDWDAQTRTAVGTRGNAEVLIPIDSTGPTVNGVKKTIDVPAQIIDGRTFIPLRFIGEALGDEISWDGNARKITVNTQAEEIIASDVTGLVLDYRLSLEKDAGSRPRMRLTAKNVTTDSLSFVINGTAYSEVGAELFTTTHNLTVTNGNGNPLTFGSSQKTVRPDKWWIFWESIKYDVITINTRGESTVVLEYDIVNGPEIWSGFGAGSGVFFSERPDDPKNFWAGYLEWILYRPSTRGDIHSAKLRITLPSGWSYASVYPQKGYEVSLGKLDYMYGDNAQRWKNYQRAPFVLFKEGPFHLAVRKVGEVEVKDIYSNSIKEKRNHAAQYEYFHYFSELIGPLPVHAALTFFPLIDGQAVPHFGAYQGAPYNFGHGLMGEYFGTGGDIGYHGSSLPQPQIWSFNSLDDQKNYSFFMHGTLRYWLVHLIQITNESESWVKGGLTTYYENMAVASRYGHETIVEHRFKPMYKYYKQHIITAQGEKDQKNFTNHSYISYFKHALTFYYINELIKEHSAGQKTLDDAVTLIYRDAMNGIPASREGLINALNSLGVYDFSGIVNEYMYGNRILDLDAYL